MERDDDDPLLFEPGEISDGVAVGMVPEGEPGGSTDAALELVPVRFADGTPYAGEPVAEASLDSDPVAEETLAREGDPDAAPRPDMLSAPIGAAVFEATAGRKWSLWNSTSTTRPSRPPDEPTRCRPRS